MNKVHNAAMILIISLLVVAIILTIFAVFTETHLYSRVATVQGFAPESDRVIFADTVGHYWVMYGIEDWLPGDIATLIMYDNLTAKVTDDKIVRATYQGCVDWIR